MDEATRKRLDGLIEIKMSKKKYTRLKAIEELANAARQGAWDSEKRAAAEMEQSRVEKQQEYDFEELYKEEKAKKTDG